MAEADNSDVGESKIGKGMFDYELYVPSGKGKDEFECVRVRADKV